MPNTNTISQTQPFRHEKRLFNLTFNTKKAYTNFNKSEILASLACAEIIKNHNFNAKLLEKLLVKTLFVNIQKNENFKDKISSPKHTKIYLLPNAIKTLDNIYKYSQFTITDFKEIIEAAHYECDFDFLDFITRIFAKAYIKNFLK